MATRSSQPNRLLLGFILLSLGLHALIFLQVAGIYESRALSYIELTLHEVAAPGSRVIPTPRRLSKSMKAASASPIKVKPFQVQPVKVDPVDEPLLSPVHKSIRLPELPEALDIGSLRVQGLKLPAMAPAEDPGDYREFTTAQGYLEMINLKIQSVKNYPESARSRHIEGRVRVEFVLERDGTISGITVIKSSRHKSLDTAAVAAIKRAAPFPRPPALLFKPPITLRVNILFELA